jgi:hypothetical protein
MTADSSGIHTRYTSIHAVCGHSIALLVASKETGLEVRHKKYIHILMSYE